MIATGESTLILTSERSEADPGLVSDVGALVETYGTLLFRVAYSVLRSRSEAEDVVQDAFVRILEHHRSLPTVRDLRVWLVRIAWNLALDRRRKIRPQQMDVAFAEALAANTVAPDQALAESRQLALLLEAIEKLPKLEREVLLLSAVEELSNAEVAKIVDRSESATRALLFRARTRLKQRMDSLECRKGVSQ
jgi:RNA polymerase sigma-70 factor (ECF subfamily)